MRLGLDGRPIKSAEVRSVDIIITVVQSRVVVEVEKSAAKYQVIVLF
jgi:hypothetical protein